MKLGPIVLIFLVLGAVTVGATIRLNRTTTDTRATEEYGERLLAHTPDYLGSYISSRLSCGSCHLGAGAEPGTLSLPESIHHYPRFSARQGAVTTIEDRVNECMTRSMNGKPLPKDSVEMKAIAAYIHSLGDRDAASRKVAVSEPPAFKTPNRAADLIAGKRVFEEKCAACHDKDGSGLGSVFPPLWGPESFNTGAGMHRILTAAKFIKAKMPLGNARLTNDEAFDVAGYINSMPRPEMAHLERDYPDLKTKPIDTGYGPFADKLPLLQHKFGPFAPQTVAK